MQLAGTMWTFDFLMRNPRDSSLIVGECKRYGKPMKQGHIASFAYLVGLLRGTRNEKVRAYYFTKTGYQLGAEKAAKFADIEIVISEANLDLDQTFSIYVREFDEALKATRQHVTIKLGAPSSLNVKLAT